MDIKSIPPMDITLLANRRYLLDDIEKAEERVNRFLSFKNKAQEVFQLYENGDLDSFYEKALLLGNQYYRLDCLLDHTTLSDVYNLQKLKKKLSDIEEQLNSKFRKSDKHMLQISSCLSDYTIEHVKIQCQNCGGSGYFITGTEPNDIKMNCSVCRGWPKFFIVNVLM